MLIDVQNTPVALYSPSYEQRKIAIVVADFSDNRRF